MLCDETLTDIDPKHLSTAPGMAFWAGSGPFGKCCHECRFWKYERGIRNDAGDVVAAKSSKGCFKFYQLTGTHGPKIEGSLRSCKYFEQRDVKR